MYQQKGNNPTKRLKRKTMKTVEVNETLVGKRVKAITTGLQVTGVITAIYEDEWSKGVDIELDEQVRWGDELYKTMQSTARKSDDFGNLTYTELI